MNIKPKPSSQTLICATKNPKKWVNFTGAKAKLITTLALIALAASGAAVFTVMTGGLDIVFTASVAGATGLGSLILLKLLDWIFGRQLPSTSRLVNQSKPMQSQKTVAAINSRITDSFVQKEGKAILALGEVLTSSATHQLNDNQLDQILDVVDQTRTVLNKNYQFFQLKEELVKKFGINKADELLKLPNLLPKEISQKNEFSTKQINQVIRNAIIYLNNQQLKIIKDKIDLQIFEQILHKAEFALFISGDQLLDDQAEESILKYAQSIKAEADFAELLKTIQEAAKRDLYFDDLDIQKKFKVPQKIQALSVDQAQRRNQLQLIINQAYISHELRQANRGKLTTGEQIEAFLLGYLGYPVHSGSNYDNKEQIFNTITYIIENDFRQENYTGPLQFVKDFIKACSLNSRLVAAGLRGKKQIEKFSIIRNKYENICEISREPLKNVKLVLPENFPLPKNSILVKALEKRFTSAKNQCIDKAIFSFLSQPDIRSQFRNDSQEAIHFKEVLDQSKDLSLEELIDAGQTIQEKNRLFEKEFEFFKKWGAFLKTELLQMYEDRNETLGGGVCWGICQHLRLEAQSQGNLSSDAFAELIAIGPTERFLQGVQTISNFEIKKSGNDAGFKNISQSKIGTIPEAYARKYGLTQDHYVIGLQVNKGDEGTKEGLANLFFELDQKIPELEKSFGWINLSICMQTGGHAILMRLDRKYNHIWLMDPNFGFFCLDAKDKSFITAKEQCFELFTDLTQLAYPHITLFTGKQMHPQPEPISLDNGDV